MGALRKINKIHKVISMNKDFITKILLIFKISEKNRSKSAIVNRTKAWDQVIKELYPNFPKMGDSEKAVLIEKHKKQWKSYRDAMLKSMKAVKEKKRVSQYVYYDELKFLIPTLNLEAEKDMEGLREDMEGLPEDMEGLPEDMEGLREDMEGLREDMEGLREDMEGLPEDMEGLPEDMEGLPEDMEGLRGGEEYELAEGEDGIMLEESEEEVEKEEASKVKRKRKVPVDAKTKFFNTVRKCVKVNYQSEDCDRCLLLSFLGEVKRIPEEEKLNFRSELIDFFKEWRNRGANRRLGA